MTDVSKELLPRLSKLYAALSTASKSYDAEAVAEAIDLLNTRAAPDVEKVARAIALSDWPGNEWTIDCFSEREQDEYRARAKAAIAAIEGGG